MGNLLSETTKKAQQTGNLIGIYTDKENVDKIKVGYVKEIKKGNLLFRSVDPNGFEDSLILLNTKDIYSIEVGSKYLKNVEVAMVQQEKLTKSSPFIFLKDKNGQLVDFLKKCLIDKVFVSVKMSFAKGIFGFINEIDDEMICMNVITESGEEDGQTYFRIEDIETVQLDGIYERRACVLLSMRNK